ncbi:MAG TPA: hypothetical protein VF544_14210 [Pyrinomonadaceae bacterium]|jgi:hypothetical protein
MMKLIDHSYLNRVALILALFCLGPFVVSAQSGKETSEQPPQQQQPAQAVDEKAEAVLKRAVEALGGSSYLNIRTSIGRGQFTPFQDGVSGLPSAFIDYIVYPDRERTEFRSQGVRNIQANVGESGWIYDGAARMVKDMTPEQVKDFRFSMRTSVENLLRGGWRKEGARLSYVGRREAGVGRRNETVRLTYADGLSVEFEFGARDGLPAKVIYQRQDAEGKEVKEEDRLAQYIAVGAVNTPFVVDHYRAGLQTSRINYESIEFNAPVPESLFARPANAKAVK